VRKPASPQFNGPRYNTGNENLHDDVLMNTPEDDDDNIMANNKIIMMNVIIVRQVDELRLLFL